MGAELARLRFGGRTCSRCASAGGDGGRCPIQEAVRDVFAARRDGERGGDVAMVVECVVA